MRFARLGQRCTAIGTITLQWLGQHKAALDDTTHELWDPVPPSNPAWDVSGMETANPGIRAKINAVTEAVTTDDVRGNVAVGRDGQLCLINGIFNTTVGYRAGARFLEVQNCVAVGRDALLNNVLGDFNVAIGAAAGADHQEGGVNVFVGYLAGKSNLNGLGNTIVGGAAAELWTTGNRNVIIGYNAGSGCQVGNDRFIVQNLENRTPLISGNFASGVVGINCKPEDTKGTLDVRAGASGVASANNAAQTLVLESNGNHGMSILGGDIQTIAFGDTADANAGKVLYNHTLDLMQLTIGGSTRISFSTTGIGFNGNSAISKPTGVDVSAAGIHAALVAYGLIS
jgi:hypothetical protein